MNDESGIRGGAEMEPDLSVAIMAYNEEKTVGLTIAEMANELGRLGIPHELVIIDDGSTDKTPSISRSLAEKRRGIRVISHPVNLGLGEVYRTGFLHCRGKYLTFFPADGQFSAKIVGDYLAKIRKADIVLGYTETPKRDPVSAILSKAERLLFRLLLGSLPEFQGVVMFRKRLLEEIELKSQGRGQIIMLELILKASQMGCRIERQKIEIFPRKEGRSKVNTLLNVWANASQLIRLRIGMG